MTDQHQPERPEQHQHHPKISKVALALLILSFVAIVVGVFNSFNDDTVPATKGKDISVASLGIKQKSILLVEISGPIMMDAPQDSTGFFESDTNAVAARKALDYAADDDNIKAVLLRINSPGGTVGMSQELNLAVQRVREKKPVVASLGDIAASGGYYTACAADKIVSNPGTLTASIGVIISSLNLKGLMVDKLGVKPVTIKSGKYKDILSPYREPKESELALIQEIIDTSYQDFLGAVVDGRTRFVTDESEKADLIQRIESVADGRVVSGEQALDVGLVDMIGDLDAAWTLADEMAKERFNLKGDKRLPLEKLEAKAGLLDYLGISFKLPDFIKPEVNPYKDLLPFSARYPNQPLWIME